MTNTDQTTVESELDVDAVAGPPADESQDSPATAAESADQGSPAGADAGQDATSEVATSDDEGSDDGNSEDEDSEDGDDEDEDSEDGDDENPLEIEAEVAADYLEELLDIADLDGDIDTYVDGDRAHVSIVSESEALVGKDGQVLDALQELTRLAVLADTGQRSRLMLDVAGYRGKRRQELVALAGDAVQEAKDSSEAVHLKAMNPFERKIVHDAVAAAGLTSESEGEEPRRHVVVLPARA
jgi:spoIIIJ-associated protein